MPEVTQENTRENVQVENPTPENATQENHPQQPEAAAPKRRGRPPKAPSLEQEKIEGAGAATAAPKPSRKKQSRGAADVGALAKQLVGIHQMASMLTGIGELQISEGEAQMLAGGVLGVAEQYDLSIDGKTGAAIQLLAAAAMVYAPRAMHIMAKAKKAREAQATTVQFSEAVHATAAAG